MFKILYEDKRGRLLTQDEIEEMSFWEIEENEIHVINESEVI